MTTTKLPIHTILSRREAAATIWDEVRIVGYFDAGESGEEVVIAPTDSYAAPVSGTLESLHADFEVVTLGQPDQEWI